MNLAYDELLRYTSAERDKWRRWLTTNPSAMEAPVQPDGRLPTVGRLIDHIFLVERRHLQRLTGDRLSDSTGLTANNVPPLFDYGAYNIAVQNAIPELKRKADYVTESTNNEDAVGEVLELVHEFKLKATN